MRTPAQRGRYGRWLVAAREARGFETADQALRAMAAAGITIGRSTYAEYEAGSKAPSRNHLPRLEEFWGPAPTDDEPPAGHSDVAAATRENTAVLKQLVEETRQARIAQEATAKALVAILAQLVPPRRPRPALVPDEIGSHR